jgi:hypothetical protein
VPRIYSGTVQRRNGRQLIVIEPDRSTSVTASLTRADLLRRGVRDGAAVVVAGGVLGALAETASADSLPNGDLAYARLLIGAELLASDFYAQAIAASNSTGAVMKHLRRAYLNEQEHYQSVAGILSGALLTPAVSSDITFSYPAGTFASEASILKFAVQLENTILGSYLGAIGGMQTDAFKGGLASIAACEAQHCSYFQTQTGGRAFSLSFPQALSIQDASNAFAAYTA